MRSSPHREHSGLSHTLGGAAGWFLLLGSRCRLSTPSLNSKLRCTSLLVAGHSSYSWSSLLTNPILSRGGGFVLYPSDELNHHQGRGELGFLGHDISRRKQVELDFWVLAKVGNKLKTLLSSLQKKSLWEN